VQTFLRFDSSKKMSQAGPSRGLRPAAVRTHAALPRPFFTTPMFAAGRAPGQSAVRIGQLTSYAAQALQYPSPNAPNDWESPGLLIESRISEDGNEVVYSRR
jgi:hypothetical protein